MLDASDDVVVDLAPEDKDDLPKSKKGGKIKYDEDEPNLCETFMKTEAGRQWLKKLCRRVIEDFDQDFDSTSEYRERMKADWKIFAGVLPPKDFPYKSSANAHLPYMLENISRLTMRAQAELFQDWKMPFGVLRVGTTPEEDEIVDILTVHGNWQIREQMPDFRRQIGSRGVLQFFCAGDVTGHSYYDPIRQRNCHEVLTCDEFVAPFVWVTTMPDYSDLPHCTRVMHRYKHEMQAMRGQWYNVDRVIKRKPPAWDGDPEMRMREAMAEVHGEEIPSDQKGAPFKLLDYRGWLEMPPSIQEGKGEPRDRYVKIVMDYYTRSPLELSIYEEPSWQEKERFERQTQELEEYRQAQAQYEQMQQQAQAQMAGLQQQAQMGMVDPMVAEQMIAQQQQQAQLAPQPLVPEWLMGEDIETAGPMPMRKEPIHMYTHAVCIEPLVGNLGLGYGRIQADYNRAADTTLSQFIDSATAGNVWSLITSNVVQFENGFEIAPGKINKVTGVTGRLDEHIKELKPAPANPQMFDLVRFMSEIAQSSIQAPNVLSGEPGKSGETYRGIAARIEQATKQLTVATQTYAEFVRQILKNNARLNAAFLPEEEMRYLMDYKIGTLKYVKIQRKLYERNYDVTFASDLRYAPQAQRVAEADEITQMALNTPQLVSNGAFAYEAIKKSLEARDRQDLVLELGQKPQAPPLFGLPSAPSPVPQPGQQPGAPGQPPQPGQGGQQNGEHPGDGGGMRPPSPGTAGGPAPPKAEHPPGPGGPVMHQA